MIVVVVVVVVAPAAGGLFILTLQTRMGRKNV